MGRFRGVQRRGQLPTGPVAEISYCCTYSLAHLDVVLPRRSLAQGGQMVGQGGLALPPLEEEDPGGIQRVGAEGIRDAASLRP